MIPDSTFAQLFLGENNVEPGATALELEHRVRSFLQKHGMDHRSPLLIASEVAKLTRALPDPEIAADENWVQANREGWGNQQLPDVSQMSMEEFANYRREAGVAPPTLLEFLGGR